MTVRRPQIRTFLKLALGLALLGSLPAVLGGCGCRCTGLVRSDSSRSLAYLMNAEGARFCDATRKTAAAPATFSDGIARDARKAWSNLRDTAEVYGGCHGHVADAPSSR